MNLPLIAQAAVESADDPAYGPVIVALLAALGILDRLTRWALTHRGLIRVVVDVLVRLTQTGDERQREMAGHILRQIEVELVKHPKSKRATFARNVERATGNGDAADTGKGRKARAGLRALATLLPGVGRLFD